MKKDKALSPRLEGWRTLAGKTLRREFAMKDFAEAVRFIGAIARAAETEDHHPDLHLTGYRNLAVELTTHAAGGLTRKDYVLARKIDGLRHAAFKPQKV